MADVISVSDLNHYVKTLLDVNDGLFDLALRGEIANFVQNARSGHCYFSLRDDACSVKAVMFRTDARRLAFRPEEGMRVVVRCRATLYERDGAFQVYVNEMLPDGLGAAQLALEQLKARLEKEGLFDPAHKKPLPAYPKCIGVVTSKTGAALQDIRNVISRRWPSVRLLLCPVTVQGFEAARQMTAAIIARGHRHVAYLGARLDERTIIKQKGYEQAMLDAGMTPYSVMVEQSSSYSSGIELMRQARREYPQLDGIFCTNDDLAVGAAFECQRLGLKIPDDMAIAGFHGHDIGQVMEPRLASVLTPRERMGRIGAERLLARIRGEAITPKMLDLGFTLSPGGSI